MFKEIEQLIKEGKSVIILVKGYSMLPFIIGGVENVELFRVEEPLKVGDIVLAWVDGNRYVLHRIISIDAEGKIILMGDGNRRGVEHTSVDEVVGIAKYVINSKNKKTYLYTRGRMLGAKIWFKLLPVRRWLLAIYRRTILKMKNEGRNMLGDKI